MTKVKITGSRPAGILLLAAGFTVFCVMVPHGVRTAIPPIFRVMIFLALDVAIPLAFCLWGLYELRSLERYEIINGGHDLRVVRRSLVRCKVSLFTLDGASVTFADRGLTGLGAGFTRLYEMSLRPTGGSSPPIKKIVRGNQTAIELSKMFAEVGCEVQFPPTVPGEK